jgi:membrane protease YdiL (CAAX protease family)
VPWLDRLAQRHPVSFGLLVSAAFVLVVAAAGIVGFPVEGEAARATVSGTVMLAGVGALLLVLRSLGWLGPAGVAAVGDSSAWRRLAWVLAYLPVVTLVAFLPDTDRVLPPPDVALAVAYESLVDGGLLQEITFRALVLYALLRAWQSRADGLLRALLVSSVLFSAVHALGLTAGAEPGVIGLQLVDTLLGGFYLGVFVVHAGSVWPAVLVHGLGNAAVTVMAAGTPGFAETPRAWVTLLVLKVPVYLYAIHLARREPVASP